MASPTTNLRETTHHRQATEPMTFRNVLADHHRANGLSVLLMVLAELAGPALLALSGLLIVLASTGIAIMLLTVQIVSVRAMALLRAAAGYGEDLVTHDSAFKLLADLRVRVWLRLIPLVPGPSDTGKLLARVSRDIDDIRDALLAGWIPAIAVPVSALVVATIAWLVDPLAGVLLTVGMIAALILTTAAALIQPDVGAIDRTRLHAQVVDTLLGADELRAYGAWTHAVDLVRATSAKAAERERRLAVRRGLATATASLVGALTTAALAVGLSLRIDMGLANHLILAPMVLMSLGAFESIGALGPAVQRIRLARNAMASLNATLTTPPVGQDDYTLSPQITTISGQHLAIQHTQVKDCSFTLTRGEVLAIVGPSGVGKTSLLRTICGLLTPSAGQFFADGQPVPHLRDVIAVAGQDAHLMPTAIGANVAIGAGPHPPQHLDMAIARAMDAAQLDEWIATLDEGINTHVGVGQVSVSGGQQRRIALARALVSDRPFVALDEPTAGLDAETATAFLDDALEVLQDRGVLMITHDEAVIARADKVLTLRVRGAESPEDGGALEDARS